MMTYFKHNHKVKLWSCCSCESLPVSVRFQESFSTSLFFTMYVLLLKSLQMQRDFFF